MILLGDDFFHPHSLQVGDMDGDGRPDIFVGEMGLGGYPNPRQVVFHNQGGGQFAMYVVGNLPTHDAKIGDGNCVAYGNGLPGIVGKPYGPGNQVALWLNRSNE
jgi:hypothetical protein